MAARKFYKIHNRNNLKPHKHLTIMPPPTITPTSSLSSTLPCPKYIPFEDKTKYKRTISVVIPLSSSNNNFRLRPLNNFEISQMILNPHMVPNDMCSLVEVASDGSIRPTTLPDLGDMSLLPKWLKGFYYWVVSKHSSSTFMRNVRAVLNQTSPALPVNREWYNLEEGTQNMVVRSFNSNFKYVSFNEVTTAKVEFSFTMENITSDWRDGRNLYLSFKVFHRSTNVSNKRKRDHGRGASICYWNCRAMGTNGFSEAFDDIVANYAPDICVFTETRMDKFMCISTIRKFSYNKVYVFPPLGLTGGVAVVIMNNSVKGRLRLASPTKGKIDLILS